MRTIVFTVLPFLTTSVYGRPAEQHIHPQHIYQHQQPLSAASSRLGKSIEPFLVGATSVSKFESTFKGYGEVQSNFWETDRRKALLLHIRHAC